MSLCEMKSLFNYKKQRYNVLPLCRQNFMMIIFKFEDVFSFLFYFIFIVQL